MINPKSSIVFEVIEVIGIRDQDETLIGKHNPLIVNIDHVIHFHKDNYISYFADKYDSIKIRFQGQEERIY